MKYLMITLLLVGMASAQLWGGRGGYDPEVNAENNVLFTMPGWIEDLYGDDVFIVSFTESINGADSCAFGIDFNSVTYDFAEVYVTASMTEDLQLGDEQAGAVVQCYPYFDMTAFTAGDTLNLQGMALNTTAVSTSGKLWFTCSCSDSTSGAREFVIGYLLPGETKTWGPFHINATVLTDSLVTGFEMITTDSAEVNWSVVAIPRV